MFLKAGFLALVSGLVLLFAQPALANGSQTYTDATGENPAAADIGAITVENDDAGNVALAVTFLNMPAFAADAVLFVALDTDRNARTGDGGGAEYVFVLDGTDQSYGFGRWKGSAHAPISGASVRAGFGGGTAHMELNRSDIGGVGTFDFYAW